MERQRISLRRSVLNCPKNAKSGPSYPTNPRIDPKRSSRVDCNLSTIKHGIHVLVVDHDKKSLLYTSRMLELRSYQVTKVDNAAKALKIIAAGKKHFDVVIAEIDLPDKDGFQFCLEVSKRGILVLLTSAKEESHLINKALENGAFLFLQRPVDKTIMKYLWQFVIKQRLEKNGGGNNKADKEVSGVAAMAAVMNAKSSAGIRIQEGKGKESKADEEVLAMAFKKAKSNAGIRIEGGKGKDMISGKGGKESKAADEDVAAMAVMNGGIRLEKGKGKEIIAIGKSTVGENDDVGVKIGMKRGRNKKNQMEDEEEMNPSDLSSGPDDENPEESNYKKKVCTEWTKELHNKFMDAVKELGEGKCYPKEILELMKVPGLTRMQVASHLQKCRHDNWRAPDERRFRARRRRGSSQAEIEAREKEKMRIFGSMPRPGSKKSQAQFHKKPQVSTTNPVPSDSEYTAASYNDYPAECYTLEMVVHDSNIAAIDHENVLIHSTEGAAYGAEQFLNMEMFDPLNPDFNFWNGEISLEFLNEHSVPTPTMGTSPVSRTVVTTFFPANEPAQNSQAADTAAANVAPLPPQPTSGGLPAETAEEIDYLLPDLPDFPLHLGIDNQTTLYTSDGVNPKQAT